MGYEYCEESVFEKPPILLILKFWVFRELCAFDLNLLEAHLSQCQRAAGGGSLGISVKPTSIEPSLSRSLLPKCCRHLSNKTHKHLPKSSSLSATQRTITAPPDSWYYVGDQDHQLGPTANPFFWGYNSGGGSNVVKRQIFKYIDEDLLYDIESDIFLCTIVVEKWALLSIEWSRICSVD